MAFNDDEKPPTSNTGSTKGLVTIKPAKYFKDDAALTADKVTAAELEINATSSTTVREGLDLVAVLDVSSSMDGEKIASVKKAMTFVIMKLTPVDRLSIVTFSNVATRVTPLRSMTPDAQNDFRVVVDQIIVCRGTNIQASLETGLAVIADRVNTKARTANIFLMSDGEQNEGDARSVDPSQVSIYTFGFGKDTDHLLMNDIAKKSPGGTFSFVPDGSQVSLPFSQLLGGLLTVVAQDVVLTLTPKTDDGDVDTIEVAPGTDYKQQTTDRGELVQLIKLMETKELYMAQGRPYALASETSHGRQRYAARGGDDESDVRLFSTPRMDTYLQQARNFEKDPTAPVPSAADDIKQEVAANLIETNHGRQRYAARGGDDKNDVRLFSTPRMDTYLQQAKNFEKDPTVPVPSAADDIKQEVAANPIETSHGRQRYAARGGDDKNDVRLFSTPRMDAYLQQVKNFEKDPTAPVPSADDDVKKEVAANPIKISHGRQRYAARGGDDKNDVRLFSTPRMDAYLQQAKNFEKDPTAPVPSADDDVKQEVATNPIKTSHGDQRYAARGGDDKNDVRFFSTPRMDTYLPQAKNFEKDPTAPVPSADDDVKQGVAANPIETSHSRQRYAARGGDDKNDVRFFSTPRMDTYLPQAKNFKKDPTAPEPSADDDVKQEVAANPIETSHGGQRYAARGGDDKNDVRLFSTPRMDTYLQQAKNFEKDPTALVPRADDDVKKEVAANPIKTSHSRQRYAARGGDHKNDVRLFSTPRMDAYLKQAMNIKKDPTAPVPSIVDDVKQDVATNPIETNHGGQRYAARGGDNKNDVRLFSMPCMDNYLQQAKNFEKDPTAPVPSADDDVKQEGVANPIAAISGELA